jgi:hypothetical protein
MKQIKSIILLLCILTSISCVNNNLPSSTEKEDTPTEIMPCIEWGISKEDLLSQQSKNLSLELSNDSILRYISKKKNVVVEYRLENNKLIATSLTQTNISSFTKIINTWLQGYNELTTSDKILLYISEDASTLVYGKILSGTHNNTISLAWTYIDPSEKNISIKYDFTPSGKENGHDYVDLGIGIGWATQNVGANSPEDNGNYYMWGETITRSSCWWWYYSLYTGSTNDYLNENKFYTPKNDISGTSYDVATTKMGGIWRTPTRAEMSSLVNNCMFETGEYNEVKGIIVTGPSGKSIFIPKAGHKEKTEYRHLTVAVQLWTSTNKAYGNAYCLNVNAKAVTSITDIQRYYGLPVRGVVTLED